MHVTVCQLPEDPARLAKVWPELVDHVRSRGTDFLLLPEMPFSRWLAATEPPSPKAWDDAVRGHANAEAWLRETGVGCIAGTRPIRDADGDPLNMGFLWTPSRGWIDQRAKSYLPEEPGFREASWYRRGPTRFPTSVDRGASADLAHVGFAICTELWFGQIAREYARRGVQLLLTPRATHAPSTDKWVAGGRAAAVVAGAWSLSSNFSGPAAGGERWGGCGWIIEPEGGEVLGTTSEDAPFLTLEIDLGLADAAKDSYPRYVDDAPIPG